MILNPLLDAFLYCVVRFCVSSTVFKLFPYITYNIKRSNGHHEGFTLTPSHN